MTDKELLELAAKAAGIKTHTAHDHGIYTKDATWWNPLKDDGDALRLAVTLRIDLRNFTGATFCISASSKFINEDADEDYGTDPCAATRRAITRAAAEIGKTK